MLCVTYIRNKVKARGMVEWKLWINLCRSYIGGRYLMVAISVASCCFFFLSLFIWNFEWDINQARCVTIWARRSVYIFLSEFFEICFTLIGDWKYERGYQKLKGDCALVDPHITITTCYLLNINLRLCNDLSKKKIRIFLSF